MADSMAVVVVVEATMTASTGGWRIWPASQVVTTEGSMFDQLKAIISGTCFADCGLTAGSG